MSGFEISSREHTNQALQLSPVEALALSKGLSYAQGEEERQAIPMQGSGNSYRMMAFTICTISLAS
jgi:hypothetical protein